jgi:predicted dehydrogenase
VQFIFGRPESVFSAGVTRPSGSVDHVVTQYLYPGGPSVYAEGSWLQTKGVGFTMSYTIHCERATLEYDLARGAEPLVVTEEGQAARVVSCEGPDGYTNEIRYVLQCAAERRKPSVVTARDGLSALEICEAEEKSVKTRTVVALPSR